MALNGFENGRYIAEDMEFVIRARMKGYKVFFEPKAKVTHIATQKKLTEILIYSYKHAKVSILLRNDYRDFLKTPSLLKSPLLILLSSPIISLKVVMDIYLRNSNLLRRPLTIPFVYCLKIAWCCGASQGLWERIFRQNEGENPKQKDL